MSGQLLNFQKSSIQFGHKIEESRCQELWDILGIQNIGGMGTYLGIPESLGGSKIQIFGFFQDRLNNRVNGWNLKQTILEFSVDLERRSKTSSELCIRTPLIS